MSHALLMRLQFLIAERHLVGALTGADRRFDVGTDRRFGHPLPVDGEAEERPQHAEAGPLCARTELQSRVEPVGIGRRELVDHHVAAAVGICRQLFRERPILAERRGGDLRALAIREEDAGGFLDSDAGRRRRRVRCWHRGCRLTAPVADGFDGCRVGAGFVPGRRAGAFAPEASGESAGDENDARAPFPAAGTLGEFTRGRILRAAGFALSPMAAVDVQRHGRILAPLPDITRRTGQFQAIRRFC